MNGPDNVTKEATARAASFDYTVTGKYTLDRRLVKYLQEGVLVVKFHLVEHHQQHVFGTARVAMQEILKAWIGGQGEHL
jgi:hypothetical protein